MKYVRYFFCCICIVFCIVMTNELRAVFFVKEIASNDSYFEIANTSVKPTELGALANEYNILLYRFDETDDLSTKEKKIDIYASSQVEKYFSSDLITNRNSVFFGKIRVQLHPLNNSNEKETEYYRLKGNSKSREDFLSLLKEQGVIENSSTNNYSYEKTYSRIMCFMWFAISVFLHLLSIFYVSITKREQMIAVTYGKSLVLIVLLHMFEDGIIIGGVCLFGALFAQSFLLLSINQEIRIFLFFILSFCTLPNLLYGKFDLKLLKNENKALRRTVLLSIVFKYLTSLFLIPILTMEMHSIIELNQDYQAVEQLQFLNNHQIIQLHTDDASLVPNDVPPELKSEYANRILNNQFYKKYLNSNTIVILHGEKRYLTDRSNPYYILYCNKNAKDYIISKFPQFKREISKADEEQSYLFIAPNSKRNLSNQVGLESLAWNYNPNIIPQPQYCYYDKEVEIYSLCKSEASYLLLLESPFILLDFRMPYEISVDIESRIDLSEIAVESSDLLMKELQENSEIECTFYPVGNSIQYKISEAKRHLFTLLLLVLSLFVQNLLMTYCIQSFDFRLNLKQYAIQKTLGVTMCKKYLRIILLVLLPYLWSIPFSLFVFDQALSLSIISAAICILTDIAVLWYLIVRVEAKRVLKLIKNAFA